MVCKNPLFQTNKECFQLLCNLGLKKIKIVLL